MFQSHAPCPNIRATPAKIRKSVIPILANGDNPDSPPKSIFFIINFPKFDFACELKEWHNLMVKTTNL